MNSLGNKVLVLRKGKGFSQEVLAKKTGLNLRTIQRIEKGETEPRGDSIQRICKTLEVGPEELLDWQTEEDRGFLTALNLSALSFLVFPLLGIILPLILWIYKKDKVLNAAETGRKVLNFQITWNLLFFMAYFYFFGAFISQFGIGIAREPVLGSNLSHWPVIMGIVLYAINLAFIIVNAVYCHSRSRVAFYPGIPFLH